ncbi:MAG: hypothetical protein QXM06_01320 [Archaeoglobaceae archaeon]
MFELVFVLLPIVLEGYDDSANLMVVGENFSGNFTVKNGSLLDLSPGNYDCWLLAMNKSFYRKINTSEVEELYFNLRFTNSTEFIKIYYHTVLYYSNGFLVSEVVFLNNTANENFEGDIVIPMPDFYDLKISSSLSYLRYEVSGNSLRFFDILIPANGKGQMILSYRLNSDVFYRDGRNSDYVLFTNLEVKSFEGIDYLGDRSFQGSTFSVYAGKDSVYKLHLTQKSPNFLPVVGIILASAGIFMFFYSRKGGWKF